MLHRRVKRVLRIDDTAVPVVNRCKSAGAILGSAAGLIAELREVELALLDRYLDLVYLVARLADLRDGAHERLARVGERLLVLPHCVRFLLAVALQLIGDVAQPVALRARGLELLRL